MGPAFGSSWNVYLASQDLARTRDEVGRLGGRVVMGPVPAGGNGRLCLAVDPVGAAVGFWEGGSDEGVVLVDEPGALCAAELHTPAPEAAAEFYRNLYGGREQVIRSSPRGAWVPFFGVADPVFGVADSADSADSAGGTDPGGSAGSSGETHATDAADRMDGMDRVVRAARAAGARPLGAGLFADPLGAVFGLSVAPSPATGRTTDPAINSVIDPAAASVTAPISG
ncbi:hypothetical protein GCM10017559_29320 [Streptosporangium longisporum]|uniref:VOC domain-containing protein n=2 Tax=Streptosporangium longisporum TaxID=46187 RepID=A0ABP6KH61_9ACTN